MRKVAASLRVDPMALYHHIDGKDALLDGVAELLFREIEFPAGGMAWDEWATTFANRCAEVAAIHRGAFGVLSMRPLKSLEALRLLDAFVDALCHAGFPIESTWEIMHALMFHVQGLASAPLATTLTYDSGDVAAENPLDAFDPQEFPRLRKLVGNTTQPTEETVFFTGLELLLDGLRHRLRKINATGG